MRPHPRDAFSIEHGMEQTSMTNAIKKRLDRKGFTLAEVLVTVAIILILAGVTFVSVVQYQKNLRLMEMDGTAKEIFIAAQNHLSVAQASGDLDRLAEKAKSASGMTDSTIGTKLDSTSVSAYAGNASGEYYYVIHNVTSGIESCTPSGSGAILQMMLPFGALDETVATGGNYVIVYELKSASVVAVLYSGAGNASFGNAAVINFSDEDVSKIKDIYNNKSARKNYQKADVTAIVGCYTGTAGSAAIPTETLEAPTLEVKNENKLHVIVSDKKSTDTVTLIIRGVQSGTVAQRILQRSTSDGHTGTGTFDVTLDDITGDDGSYRFANIISPDRFTATPGTAFIPGENIEISARVSSTTGLATPKESAKYTVSSLFGDVNETKDAGNTTVYIKNLRHLENLGANVSDFTAALGNGTTSGSSKVVNIIAEQKNDITMFSMSTSGSAGGNHFENLRGSKIYGMKQEATFAAIDVNYPLVYHGNQHEIHDVSIGAQKDHTAGGIFGQVADPASSAANASLSVSDLILRNNRVSGTNVQNAGMLVGETTKNLTVDGVLAYYHEDTYDETKDSSVEVTASENAGGLIGLVSGGKLDVKNSAAAVYVKGGSAAGGLIGSVSGAADGSTIVQSYAGGHTRAGAYSTMDATTNKPVLEGPGRYNVQASGNAGGFIGVTSNQVQMDNVYATTSVYSSSYSDGNKCSGSFAGTGTLNIPAKAEKDGSKKKHYYALGPHNGVDATKEELACAELAQGQAHRQATPYDRKLVLNDKEKVHQKMDKTSYPLCTVRNLCEWDASIKDADLPWFIKEHVGDWVVQKAGEAGFEVDNGNRLTVRINTGLKTISEDLYYAVKVHGETFSQNDAYFLLHINSNGIVEVKRKFNHDSEWKNYDKSIAALKSGDTSKELELYLDDITNPNGNFVNVCSANYFYPGEDISINAIPVNSADIGKELVYVETKKQYTNSLFGYLQNQSKYSEDTHNEQKISAVKAYDQNAGSQPNGEGLVVVEGKYYAQVDNSRHLENLSKAIGYPWTNITGTPIAGAIQTDDIYWSGKSTAYTISFTEELGSHLNVYSKDGIKSTNGHFSPIDYCANVVTYDGSNHKIDGFSVEENGLAGLFSQPQSEITIKNLKVNKSSFISSGGRAGGLIGENDKHTTIENVRITDTVVKGSGTSGGFVGFAGNGITITKSGFSNIKVTSTTDAAGGFVGSTGGTETTIKEVNCDGNMIVIGKNASGGIIGQTNQSKVTVDTAKFLSKAEFLSKVEVTSETTHAGGVIGISGGEAEIKNTTFSGGLTVNGANSSGGIIGNANGKLTVDWVTFDSDVTVTATSANVHAGGIVGYANGEADIKNTTFNRKLTVSGENSSAGIIGNANAKATVKYASFQSDVTVTSTNDHAAGVLGITNNHEADIENVTFSGKLNIYGNKSSGGILGNTGSKLKLCDISIGGGSTIASVNGDAGGVVGFAQSYDADIRNIKFIGKDTQDAQDTQDAEVIANGNAGGLCGVLTENSKLTISNVAVSAFIQAKENAGGLIGRLKTSASEGKIEKSYYGGRTQEGQYAWITINDNENPYTSNIHGSQRAGGLMGYIENTNGLTIEKCFSTGSVENGADNQNAGGFIGAAEQSGIKILNCYSIGKVSSQNNGGFIGYRNDSSNLAYENVYYLNTFNDPSVKAIGNGTEEENKKLTTKYADNVLGKNETSDVSVQTNSYDEALKGEIYPYKNWTTDWMTKGKPIAYYGDWPLPSKLAGELIYFSAKNDKNYKKGGLYKVTGQNTNVECYMTPIGDFTLERYGFGIISEYPITDQSIYEMLKERYAWSNNLYGEFKNCKIEGSAEKPEYSVFTYFGKQYYYYRCTTSGGLNIQSGLIYVKDTKVNPVITYQVSVSNGEAQFTVVSGG